MAGRSRTGASPLAWSTILYLLFIFILPLASNSVHAQDEQKTMKEDLGDGEFPASKHDWLALTHRSVIGIDLGTTYSCVGVMQNGKVEILVNDQGNRITPSYVAFNDEERLVGDAAKNQYSSNPTRTVFDIKRLIGRKWSDKDVQADVKHFPYRVKGQDGKPVVTVEVKGTDKTFSPEEISAMILGKMKGNNVPIS